MREEPQLAARRCTLSWHFVASALRLSRIGPPAMPVPSTSFFEGGPRLGSSLLGDGRERRDARLDTRLVLRNEGVAGGRQFRAGSGRVSAARQRGREEEQGESREAVRQRHGVLVP